MATKETIYSLIFKYLKSITDVYSLSQCNTITLRAYRATDVWYLTTLTGSPQEKLAIFLRFYLHLPAQGSPKWLEFRSGAGHRPPTFGGSEIGSLFGVNQYQSKEQLIATKLQITKFEGNTATRWGNLFEEVLFGVVDYLYSCKTYETGSIPGLRDTNGDVIQSYSPDRLGIVGKSNFISMTKMLDPNLIIDKIVKPLPDELIVLMEGKCPYSRVPDGKVPKQYSLQPLLGACTIPIVDVCLYVDGMFRLCSLADFYLSDGDLAIGFIGIYEKTGPKREFKGYGEKSEKDDEKVAKEKMIKEAKSKMSQELRTLIVENIQSPGSDFYELPLKMRSIMSLCVLCDRFLGILYDQHLDWAQIMSRIDEEEVVVEVLSELVGKPRSVKMIIPDALQANYIRGADYDTTFAGIDYGSFSGGQFASMLKNVIDNRFTDSGYKAYYPDCFYVAERVRGHFPQTAKFYQDPSLPELQRCKKWLYKNLREYTQWCSKNEMRSIGYVLWKMP